MHHSFPTTARSLALEDISEGDTVGFEVTVEAEDVDQFAKLTGDYSPRHMSEDYARSTGSSERVVHGMLLASLGSTICGMLLPGRRAIIVSQKTDFLEQTPVGAQLTVSARVTHVSVGSRAIRLNVVISHGGLVVMRGMFMVRVEEGE